MAGPRKRATLNEMLEEYKRMRTLGQTTQQTGFVSPPVPYPQPVDDPRPAYYFCIACWTVECYRVVPVIHGEPGVPWHNHGAGQVRLAPITEAHAARLVRQNPAVVFAFRHNEVLDVIDPVPGVKGLGGERLEEMLAVIEERGW